MGILYEVIRKKFLYGKMAKSFFCKEYEMNIEEIQQAVTKLSPDELTRFHEWLKEYKSKVKTGGMNDSRPHVEVLLKKYRGSFKGKGLLKALMEDRRNESLL
jgi:predicted phage tail protein